MPAGGEGCGIRRHVGQHATIFHIEDHDLSQIHATAAQDLANEGIEAPVEAVLDLEEVDPAPVAAVTELKRREQELAQKEAQLRVALDNMPGGMALEDRDRNYVLFNSQYSELHDYPAGFLKVGMPVREEVRFQAERGDFGPGDTDDLAEQGRIIRKEQEGLALVIDRDKLTKKGKAEAIKGIKDVLSHLED